MVVGIGMNGHIGFNEPAESFSHYAHVVDLDENTKTVGQKYFKQHTPLTKGITLGLQHLLDAKKAILMANGIKKADIMRKTLEENITPHIPASIMRKHRDGVIMIDEEAAAKLTTRHS
jgi:6-phosphogluconolactonase/glucosamine-6-phosphate isomerase/deaminase